MQILNAGVVKKILQNLLDGIVCSTTAKEMKTSHTSVIKIKKRKNFRDFVKNIRPKNLTERYVRQIRRLLTSGQGKSPKKAANVNKNNASNYTVC